MAIDSSQFLQTFFEESFEGLEIMESNLLTLQPGAADTDVVNTIFRAAHSIKGGAGTFGLNEVASFTHLVETLLDQMRDGTRMVTGEAVSLLLKSVDCVQAMLRASQAEEPIDDQAVDELKQQLQALLDEEQSSGEDPDAAQSSGDAEAGVAETAWRITFRPYPNFYFTGNDPLRIVRELEQLGKVEIEADLSGLPSFDEFEPENSYLAWTIRLGPGVQRADIEEAFAWVEGDCELCIEPLEGPASAVQDTAENKELPAGADAICGELIKERRKGGDRRNNPDRRSTAKSSTEANSIRVGIDKVDSVINLVGELVITQSMLSTLGEDFDMSKLHALQSGIIQLERNTRELQEQVMRMRMLPIGFVFNRFPRMVHDLSAQLSKKVLLEISGEGTELDKTVIERISDPLIHLVRNSLDHGIEPPERRIEAGKPETGTVWLNAYHKGGNIVIEVKDNGRGLDPQKVLAKARERDLITADAQLSDEQIYELIFLPGFSTADTVSDVSGRGVGMDVVRRNIQQLGGSVEVSSKPGEGSTFTVRLPLTLAILDGQTVRVGEESYIVPLVAIIESLQVQQHQINRVGGQRETFHWRDEYLPVIRLGEAFGGQAAAKELTEGLLVVVEGEGRRIGLFVDDLENQQQVVIKSLETNYKRVDGISGATILGDGSVALILDIPGLIRSANQEIEAYEYRKRA